MKTNKCYGCFCLQNRDNLPTDDLIGFNGIPRFQIIMTARFLWHCLPKCQ